MHINNLLSAHQHLSHRMASLKMIHIYAHSMHIAYGPLHTSILICLVWFGVILGNAAHMKREKKTKNIVKIAECVCVCPCPCPIGDSFYKFQ